MLLHGAPVDSRHWMEAFSGEQVFQFFGIDATGALAGLGGLLEGGLGGLLEGEGSSVASCVS